MSGSKKYHPNKKKFEKNYFIVVGFTIKIKIN